MEEIVIIRRVKSPGERAEVGDCYINRRGARIVIVRPNKTMNNVVVARYDGRGRLMMDKAYHWGRYHVENSRYVGRAKMAPPTRGPLPRRLRIVGKRERT